MVESGFFPRSQVQETGFIAAPGKFARLAEIINAGPDEIADDVIVVAHTQPVMNAGRGLGAQAEAVREPRALGSVSVGAVQAVNVIVAGDVERIHEAVS